MSVNKNLLPKLSLIVAVFFWGSSFIAMKHAVLHIDPGKIIFLRMLIASIIFIALFKLWGKVQYKKYDWIYLSIMAACEPGLYFILESQALRFTTAGAAASINALQPPIVAILAWLILKEKSYPWTFAGFIICIVGAVGLSIDSESSAYAPAPWLGNLLEFGAMVASAFYIVILKNMCDRYSPFFLTALQSFAGVVLFFPFLFYGDSFSSNIPISVGISILYLATAVTFGGYFLYNWGVASTSATEASIYLNLIPIFGVSLAYVVLAEVPTIKQLLMIGTIIVGVLICEYGYVFFSRNVAFKRKPNTK